MQAENCLRRKVHISARIRKVVKPPPLKTVYLQNFGYGYLLWTVHQTDSTGSTTAAVISFFYSTSPSFRNVTPPLSILNF